MHSSDIAVDINSRYGSKRKEGRPPTPDTAFYEQYATMVQNDVERPIMPRNAVSCRKAHRENTIGDYVPPFDDKAAIVHRKGFMVECDTDSDCYSRCGTHPVTGNPYVCTHNPQFYTYAGVVNSSFYTIDEPGAMPETRTA